MSDYIVTTGCTECGRNAAQLDSVRDGTWECCCVDCPHRRAITAAPPEGATEATGRESSGCWRVRPVFQED